MTLKSDGSTTYYPPVYLDKNVYEAGKDRMNYIFDEFENVVIWVSGGKDSTVLFNLSLEVARERNKLPLKVAFIDQEAEWENTIDIIRDIMYREEVEPYWFQMPILLSNATSYDERFLDCWNPDKEDVWMREREPISIKENKYGTKRFHKLFEAISKKEWGGLKTADLSAVRCEESPGRRVALTSSATYKYVTWGKKHSLSHHVTLYPLYDWSYTDIWKYIHDNELKYNHIYDIQYQHGMSVTNMRVSNLHHETSLQSLFYMQEAEPETYDKLTRRLRGIDSMVKFGASNLIPKKLPFMFKSWVKYRDYLLEKLIPECHQEDFRKTMEHHDLEFEGSPFYDKIVKAHINAIICNDYSGTKLNNLGLNYSTPSTRATKRHKGRLMELEKLKDDDFGVGVVTVSGREDYLKETLKTINYKGIEVLKNLGHNLITGQMQSWKSLFSGGAEFAILFEDDVKACKNVVPALMEIAKAYDPPFLTAYSNRKEVREKSGIFRISPRIFLNAQAVVMRADTWEDFTEWFEAGEFKDIPEGDLKRLDAMLQHFMVKTGVKPYATSPSLVQHVGKESMMGHPWKVGGRPRETKDFDEEFNAMELLEEG